MVNIKRIICNIIIILFVVLFSITNVYASGYDAGEFTTSAPTPPSPSSGSGGGSGYSPQQPSDPGDAPMNQIEQVVPVQRTTQIEGHIYEAIEAMDEQQTGHLKDGNKLVDSSKNVMYKGIPDVNLDLYVDDVKIPLKTNNSGLYKTGISQFPDGMHKIYLKYSFPNVTESSINNISSVEDALKIQKKLKYNGQDYTLYTQDSKTSIELAGKGIAQIFILLDCSQSMNEKITVSGEEMTVLELEKNIAKGLIEDLLKEDKNIVIGLVAFREKSYRVVSLTNNKDTLINRLNQNIEFPENMGYTNIVDAINKADDSFVNKNKANSNRYIFILSDGLPTADATSLKHNSSSEMGAHNVYSVPNDSRRQEIINHNEEAFKLIATETKDRIKEIEDNGITVFSAIATQGLTNEEKERVKYIYKDDKDDNYNKFMEVQTLDEVINSSFIKYLKNYVKDSIKVTYTDLEINKETRGEKIINTYNNFNYSNTIYFEALDMKIENDADIFIFRNYAKKLLEIAKIEVTTPVEEVEFFNPPLPEDQYEYDGDGNLISHIHYVYDDITIQGPDSYLEKLKEFVVEPSITLTNIYVKNANENIIKYQAVSTDRLENRQTNMYLSIDEHDLYGDTVKITYTIELENKSLFNNLITNIGLIIYLPDKFVLNDVDNKAVLLIDKNKFFKISSQTLTQGNIDNYISHGYIPANGLIHKYIKNGHNALLISIDNTNKIKFPTNGKIQFKLTASTILADGEYGDFYDGKVEIVRYSNDAFRRLQYSTVASDSKLGFKTVVAGNMDENENDYSESNKAVIIPPTGADLSKTKIYIINVVGIILAIVIVYIKRHIKK